MALPSCIVAQVRMGKTLLMYHGSRVRTSRGTIGQEGQGGMCVGWRMVSAGCWSRKLNTAMMDKLD